MSPAAYQHLLINRFRKYDMTDCVSAGNGSRNGEELLLLAEHRVWIAFQSSLPFVAATNNAEQKRNFTHSFQYWRGRIPYNGDIRADREGARLPARLVNRHAFIFWGDFMPGGKEIAERKRGL